MWTMKCDNITSWQRNSIFIIDLINFNALLDLSKLIDYHISLCGNLHMRVRVANSIIKVGRVNQRLWLEKSVCILLLKLIFLQVLLLMLLFYFVIKTLLRLNLQLWLLLLILILPLLVHSKALELVIIWIVNNLLLQKWSSYLDFLIHLKVIWITNVSLSISLL